jgi:hypothetical protein
MVFPPGFKTHPTRIQERGGTQLSLNTFKQEGFLKTEFPPGFNGKVGRIQEKGKP